MELHEYQTKCLETAIYPEQYKIAYPCLGLIGEIGEFVEKSKVDPKELGDIMWYCAILTNDLGAVLAFSELTPKITTIGLSKGMLTVIGLKIAEKVKKVLRDKSEISGVLININQIVTVIKQICELNSIDFNFVLESNIMKLQSRKQRGVLGGSGDDR